VKTNKSPDPHSALKREMVQCVRVLMDAFPLDLADRASGSPKQLEASLKKLQEGPPLFMDYLMLAFSAVTVRWAAHETGRNEKEILDEIARAFSAMPIDDDGVLR
jgi:hypothetical protein